MRTRFIAVVAAIGLVMLVGARSTAALSFVLPTDQVLADSATLIVEGTVSDLQFADDAGATNTRSGRAAA